ncbi:DUF3800 domain-containing protein [Erysipelothrix anatis]|uniref:DUF3800 domain-containing protein n=1 Tax=Erysipelothrix anatis TaxID=2683713 RepID=UPI0013583988|nr:DUF3800 domain-containing protein [Erysipelothrix anatis]
MSKTTILIIDESGAMHNPKDRFFIIAGYLTSNFMACRSHQKSVEKEYKERYSIPLSSEVKGSSIQTKDNIFINDTYIAHEHITPVAIVIDKKHLKLRLSENMGYNYYTGLLIKNLVNEGYIDCEECDEIILMYDDRSLKLDARMDLGAYLQHQLVELGYDKKFTFQPKDSKNNPEIKIADIIANTLYRVYQKKDRIIQDRIKTDDTYYISKFPRYNFGK